MGQLDLEGNEELPAYTVRVKIAKRRGTADEQEGEYTARRVKVKAEGWLDAVTRVMEEMPTPEAGAKLSITVDLPGADS